MNVRAYAPEDAAAVAALAAAEEERFHGHRSHVQAEDVVAWMELAKEAWVYEDDGRLLAAGWCGRWGPAGTIVGVVAAKGRGIGSDVVDRCEERLAQETGLERLHGIAPEPDGAARRLFESRGYGEVRRFYDMAIQLEREPVVPALPDGLVLDEAREGEERAFYDALVEAFQDHWDWHATPYEEWLEMRRGQHHDEDGPLWLVVRDGDEIAAISRNEANRHGGGYVGALGVRRPWRGRGLAKALLQRTFAEFWRRDMPRVTLGVDADSPTGATHLYERVGMHVESATVVFEKALG
jgi:mycothiol synthase